MTAHLTLPYNWTDCNDPKNCIQGIHLADTAENLNNYPKEWVETLLGCSTLDDDRIAWINPFGEYHRVDGPAIVSADGKQEWYLNGRRHREGGPSLIESGGTTTYWHRHGKCHREDGPAITYYDSNGKYRGMYYLNGELIKEVELKPPTKLALPRNR